MPTIYPDSNATGCYALAALVRGDRARNKLGLRGMHSVGGWHTSKFKLGVGWLGEAMRARLERAGVELSKKSNMCWANILPAGSSYGAHAHKGNERVAVWCLEGKGELHIERADGSVFVVPDRPGQLVLFNGNQKHWVPQVSSERITVAVNLR